MSINQLKKLAVLAALSLAPFLASPAHAASGNVEVEADSMEIIDAEHKTIFTGNVVSTRPSETIHADEMIVSTTEVKQDDGTMKTVTNFVDAKGSVTITTKNQVITGTAAKFRVLENLLEVTGNVKVVAGESTLKGEKLLVDLKTNHLQMAGGRVKGSFIPPK